MQRSTGWIVTATYALPPSRSAGIVRCASRAPRGSDWSRARASSEAQITTRLISNCFEQSEKNKIIEKHDQAKRRSRVKSIAYRLRLAAVKQKSKEQSAGQTSATYDDAMSGV